MRLLIAALSFLISSAWAQQPAPSALPQPAIAGQINERKAEEPKQQPAPEQSTATPAPSIVKIPQREEAHKETQTSGSHTPENPPKPESWNLSDKIAIGALIAALLQFSALIWTIGVMRSSAQRQLRAYVGIVGGEMTYINLIEGGYGLDIHIMLKNFGQTPGYKLTTWIKPPQILDKGVIPFDEPIPINERNGESFLGPGGEFHIRWTIPIADTDLASINDGSKKIFVWGGLDFIDAFRRQRHFIFRMINSNLTVRTIGERFALQPHKAGYDAN